MLDYSESVINVTELSQLYDELDADRVPYQTWRGKDAKTVAELHKEIKYSGEVCIIRTPQFGLERLTTAAFITVQHTDQILTEVRQEYISGPKAGYIRYRTNPFIGETGHVGESGISIASRGLDEELGLWVEDERLSSGLIKVEESTKNTDIYPGLPTRRIRYYYGLDMTDAEYQLLLRFKNPADEIVILDRSNGINQKKNVFKFISNLRVVRSKVSS